MKNISFKNRPILLSSLIFLLLLSTFLNTGILRAQVGNPVPIAESGGIAKKECGLVIFGSCIPLSLDSLGVAAGKMLAKYITESIVDWINSGFNGSPAFLSNPEGFFIDMADQEIGAFIEGSSDLNFLCSPIAIDIRLALAFRNSPFKRRVSCTLSEVISNVQNIPNTVSINGQGLDSIANGDFTSRGGWDNFVNVTQSPQNNVYGAYLMAEYELDARLAFLEKNKRDELGQGKGFLSYRKCEDIPTSTDPNFVGPISLNDANNAYPSNFVGPVERGSIVKKQKCTVQTPGATINDSLSNVLGSGMRQLELADEFDEIVNALISQLVQQVIVGGLRSTSGGGSSDSSSYFNNAGANLERQQKEAQLSEGVDNLNSQIITLSLSEQKYYDSYSNMYNNLIALKARFEELMTCNSSGIFNQRSVSTRAQEILEQEINPKLLEITSPYNTSKKILESLDNYSLQVDRAENIEDLRMVAQRASAIANTVHTSYDISTAQAKEIELLKKINILSTEGSRYESICR